jgi:hypothetical protein
MSGKRHHYIPSFFLSGFTLNRHRDDKFAGYGREKSEFRTQKPDTPLISDTSCRFPALNRPRIYDR